MNIPDKTLMDYLLGLASAQEAAELEQRLAGDAGLQQRVAQLQAGIVKVTPASKSLSSSLRDRIMAGTDPANRFKGFAARLGELFDLPAQRVDNLLHDINRFPQAPWTTSNFRDVHALHFDGGANLSATECGLVHMPPDTPFPMHGHRGAEGTLVLQGESVDDAGVRLLPGDFCLKQAGEQHSFRSVGKEPLIFAVFHHGLDVISDR